MNFQLYSVFALLGALSQCSAHVGGQSDLQDLDDPDPHYYCGRNLAKITAALCDLSERSGHKRANTGREIIYKSILNPYYKERSGMTWPWISPRKAQGLELSPRAKRGIATECCDKACNIEELLSYC